MMLREIVLFSTADQSAHWNWFVLSIFAEGRAQGCVQIQVIYEAIMFTMLIKKLWVLSR